MAEKIEVIYRKNPNYGQPGEPEMLPAETVVTAENSPELAWDEFDFRKRFTNAERKAILSAAKIDQDVEDFVEMLACAGRTGTRIKADDATLVEALAVLEGSGLIGEGRAAEIRGVKA